jgi:hypothetical protein
MSFSLIQASSFCSASILFTKVSRSPSLAFATPCRSRQLEAPIRVCSAVRTSEHSQTGATTSSSGSLELVSTKDVAETEVADRQRLFNRIAPMYDSLNDWLSLGQHRVWKRMAVSWSGAKLGDSVLDICCGSGDVAFLLAEKVGPQGKVCISLSLFLLVPSLSLFHSPIEALTCFHLCSTITCLLVPLST